eukprot:351323-Chlamydomonas_euryale.AAC.21
MALHTQDTGTIYGSSHPFIRLVAVSPALLVAQGKAAVGIPMAAGHATLVNRRAWQAGRG